MERSQLEDKIRTLLRTLLLFAESSSLIMPTMSSFSFSLFLRNQIEAKMQMIGWIKGITIFRGKSPFPKTRPKVRRSTSTLLNIVKANRRVLDIREKRDFSVILSP